MKHLSNFGLLMCVITSLAAILSTGYLGFHYGEQSFTNENTFMVFSACSLLSTYFFFGIWKGSDEVNNHINKAKEMQSSVRIIPVLLLVMFLASCNKNKECVCVSVTDRSQHVIFTRTTQDSIVVGDSTVYYPDVFYKDSVYHVNDSLTTLSPINTNRQKKDCKSESQFAGSNGDITHVKCDIK